jgi:hypothetical protein
VILMRGTVETSRTSIEYHKGVLLNGAGRGRPGDRIRSGMIASKGNQWRRAPRGCHRLLEGRSRRKMVSAPYWVADGIRCIVYVTSGGKRLVRSASRKAMSGTPISG